MTFYSQEQQGKSVKTPLGKIIVFFCWTHRANNWEVTVYLPFSLKSTGVCPQHLTVLTPVCPQTQMSPEVWADNAETVDPVTLELGPMGSGRLLTNKWNSHLWALLLGPPQWCAVLLAPGNIFSHVDTNCVALKWQGNLHPVMRMDSPHQYILFPRENCFTFLVDSPGQAGKIFCLFKGFFFFHLLKNYFSM